VLIEATKNLVRKSIHPHQHGCRQGCLFERMRGVLCEKAVEFRGNFERNSPLRT